MPTAYITNMVAFRDYSQVRLLFDSVAVLTAGVCPSLDVEDLARHLTYATKDDTLVVDGSPLVSGVALSIWLEHLGEANIIEVRIDGELVPRKLSRSSLRRIIEQAFDREELKRGSR